MFRSSEFASSNIFSNSVKSNSERFLNLASAQSAWSQVSPLSASSTTSFIFLEFLMSTIKRCFGESDFGANVWRIGILVRFDQSRNHCVDDHRWSRRHFIWTRKWRSASGD